jgi:hypothetical protein
MMKLLTPTVSPKIGVGGWGEGERTVHAILRRVIALQSPLTRRWMLACDDFGHVL